MLKPFNEQFVVISPDDRWVVYVSDETGSGQAFVQFFPEPGMKQRVFKTGAIIGAWAQSGREIFVFRPDFSLISVPVIPGPELRFATPRQLYRLPLKTRGLGPAPDRQRFLATIPAERTVPGISVDVNWRAGREQ